VVDGIFRLVVDRLLSRFVVGRLQPRFLVCRILSRFLLRGLWRRVRWGLLRRGVLSVVLLFELLRPRSMLPTLVWLPGVVWLPDGLLSIGLRHGWVLVGRLPVGLWLFGVGGHTGCRRSPGRRALPPASLRRQSSGLFVVARRTSRSFRGRADDLSDGFSSRSAAAGLDLRPHGQLFFRKRDERDWIEPR
jgi:hypothetical protein